MSVFKINIIRAIKVISQISINTPWTLPPVDCARFKGRLQNVKLTLSKNLKSYFYDHLKNLFVLIRFGRGWGAGVFNSPPPSLCIRIVIIPSIMFENKDVLVK